MGWPLIYASHENFIAFWATKLFFAPFPTGDGMVDPYTCVAECASEFTEFIGK